jgi:hypothetical protein
MMRLSLLLIVTNVTHGIETFNAGTVQVQKMGLSIRSSVIEWKVETSREVFQL